MEPFAECEKDQRPKQQHARQADDVIRFRLHDLDKLNTILPPAFNQEFRSKSLPVVRQEKLLANPPCSQDYPRIATRPLELPTFRTAPVDSTFVGQTAMATQSLHSSTVHTIQAGARTVTVPFDPMYLSAPSSTYKIP